MNDVKSERTYIMAAENNQENTAAGKKKFLRAQTSMAACLIAILICAASITGCELLRGDFKEAKGHLTGVTYTIDTFDNFGNLTMQTHGENIDMESNVVREWTYSDDDGWGYTKTLSSVVTINIDGKEMVTCGDTCIFYEDGLKPEVDFTTGEDALSIQSSGSGLSSKTFVAGIVNKYKNSFGKPMIVIVKSQTGSPIYAFSGDSVNWEVCEDLPKTTRLSIDGHLMYIHRGNFQLIDASLLK